MNVADTLRGLLRRWYVTVPGLVLAFALAVATYVMVPPVYQRTATQLLMPGEGTVPPGATNPYLYLGGLTQAADIVVRVMQSNEVLGPVAEKHPDAELKVARDSQVSGPAIQITVTASSDAAAASALDALVDQTGVVLERLQTQQKVTPDDQMRVATLTEDTQSTLQQKNRLVLAAAVGFAAVLLTLVVASMVDGLIRRARRSGRGGVRKRATAIAAEDVDESAAEVDADDVTPDAVVADAEGADVPLTEAAATDAETGSASKAAAEASLDEVAEADLDGFDPSAEEEDGDETTDDADRARVGRLSR
ncbi:MAG: hypothetical protein IE924_01145 [Microbacterium sp.]|uniref:hypothetical protein n=1 Tax=Microbacterium sp. TaxID=51671 RepID=UPI00199493EA|nr:hypothetical protein [Microbacterium sp.]MBD3756701.1 hypothetical protein [Microbacterium sp.]